MPCNFERFRSPTTKLSDWRIMVKSEHMIDIYSRRSVLITEIIKNLENFIHVDLLMNQSSKCEQEKN